MKHFAVIICVLSCTLSCQALAFDFGDGGGGHSYPSQELAIKYYEESHELQNIKEIEKYAEASGLLLVALLSLNSCQLYKYKLDGTADDKLPAAPGPMSFGFKAKGGKIVGMSEYLNLDSMFKLKFYWKYIARKFPCSNEKGTICQHERMKYELRFFNEHATNNKPALLIVNTPKVPELSVFKNTFYICY